MPFTYTILTETPTKTAKVTGYSGLTTGANYTIDYIDGYKITQIASIKLSGDHGIFYNCNAGILSFPYVTSFDLAVANCHTFAYVQCKEIYLPSLTFQNADANWAEQFHYCTNLQIVEFGNTQISEMFSYCTFSTTIKILGAPTLGAPSTPNRAAFSQCTFGASGNNILLSLPDTTTVHQDALDNSNTAYINLYFTKNYSSMTLDTRSFQGANGHSLGSVYYLSTATGWPANVPKLTSNSSSTPTSGYTAIIISPLKALVFSSPTTMLYTYNVTGGSTNQYSTYNDGSIVVTSPTNTGLVYNVPTDNGSTLYYNVSNSIESASAPSVTHPIGYAFGGNIKKLYIAF
jgi:hypothetical protein